MKENKKTIDLNSKEYCLADILSFCNFQKCNDDEISCYLEVYRNNLKSKRRTSLKFIKLFVDKVSYPYLLDYKENGPLFESYPGELPDESDKPEEFETKEKLIADIVKLEKELNIN